MSSGSCVRFILSIVYLSVAAEAHASADRGAAMTIGSLTRGPAPHAAFCRAFPGECRVSGGVVDRVALTPERLRELGDVNAQVNSSVREVPDAVHYGREDVWALPLDGQGDCEDFALMKRKLLIERGWPSSVLLITIVRTPSGEGHAVLTAATSAGDLVLDNRRGSIEPWSQTGYLFFMRQSGSDPRSWVNVDLAYRHALAQRMMARTTGASR